jgi:hypothetical protein
MKNFKRVNNLLGWVLFGISTAVYLLTLEPTVSLWDCGEFIASAFKLQVGHPPGAPFFMILARTFSLFAGDHHDKVAMLVNASSAISSGLTIMFLYWTIVHLAQKLSLNREQMIAEAISDSTIELRDQLLFSVVELWVLWLTLFQIHLVFCCRRRGICQFLSFHCPCFLGYFEMGKCGR